MGKFNDNYFVDPNSIYIAGWIHNWQMLSDFLFEEENSILPELIENIEENKMYEVDLDTWLDSDDDKSWIEYSINNAELI